MPKSFFSDDPFAAAFSGRRPASTLLLLVVPALGFALMAVGMHAQPGVGASPLAVEKPSRCENRVRQLASIETARRNVLHWQRESCCGAATPHSRAKMRLWQHGYQQRLAVYTRMYPKWACPK